MNIPQRLKEMGETPAMFALTREGFLMQVMVLLETLDLDARPLLCSTEHLRDPIIATEDDLWAQELIEKALGMIK